MANSVTSVPLNQSPSEQEIDRLVVKYRPEIDRIKWMDSPQQMQALADLGVDPKALEEHYKPLRDRADALREQDKATTPKTNIMGWGALAGGAAAAFALSKKLSNKLVRGILVATSGLASGFGGVFVGSRIFRSKIREESRVLNVEAKNAFERELAVALENKARETSMPEVVVPAQSVTSTVAPRDASFVAQAGAEKVAEQAAGVQRS